MQDEAHALMQRFIGVNRSKFAREHAVPGGSNMIYQHINALRPMSLDAALAYARGFAVPLSEISPRIAREYQAAVGAEEPRLSAARGPDFEMVTEDGHHVVLEAKYVPIVGTARMGDDGFYEEISSIAGAGDGHIEIATQDKNAYGLRVRGQSMFPAIRDGWYVLIEPNGTPREGEYVLLKLADGRKMVKELLFQRNGSIEVMSVNGGERMTIDRTDLHEMQPVGAVVSPSKWRPT